MRNLTLIALVALQDAREHPVDAILQSRWKELKITPARLSSDEEFLRRVTLDLNGTLPEPEEIRAFIASKAADKRARKIDELLSRADWAAFWSDRLAALLLPSENRRKAIFFKPLRDHLKDRLAKDTPYDKLVSEMLTASGSNKDEDLSDAFLNSFLFLDRTQRKDLAVQVSKVFMGLQLQCAQCHDHPFEKWTKDDFFSIVANFAPVALRPIDRGDLKNPFDDTVEIIERPMRFGFRPEGYKVDVKAKFFDGEPVKGESLRSEFTRRLVDPANAAFSRAAVNRMWAWFFGAGLVEPVDDLSERNAPVVPELLDLMAKGFIENKFDLKWLMRTIATSRAYQLSSARKDGEGSEAARRYYAYGLVRPMSPEQKRGAILKAQGIDEGMFAGLDEFRMRVRGMQEPSDDGGAGEYNPNLQQIMRMLDKDSPQYRGIRARGRGRLAQILRQTRRPEQVIEELYLATVSRPPNRDELNRCLKYLRDHGEGAAAYEDLFFVLLNTNEFYFNH
jgi:hypothetical protein